MIVLVLRAVRSASGTPPIHIVRPAARRRLRVVLQQAAVLSSGSYGHPEQYQISAITEVQAANQWPCNQAQGRSDKLMILQPVADCAVHNGFDIKSKAGFKAPAGAVCEHILELNILRDVMESPGGPCQQIVDKFQCTDKPTAAEIKAPVAPLVKIINGKNVNVVFAQKSSLEAQKGLIVEQALGRGSGLDVPGLDTANKALRLQGANDYLTRTSNGADGPNTLQVAANLDAEIQKTFPGTKAKAVDEWKKVLNLAKASA
ncbi:hypothetical protein FB451DRAFT_1402684 [Mycena latifolia]|nr:hypothetical protein FB451DRAFT_1402684 [Mycena latifolia]